MEKKSLSTVITSSRNLFQNSQKKTGFIFLGSAEPCRSRILSYIRWVRRRATGCARSLWQGKYSVQIFEFLFIIWYFWIFFMSFWFFPLNYSIQRWSLNNVLFVVISLITFVTIIVQGFDFLIFRKFILRKYCFCSSEQKSVSAFLLKNYKYLTSVYKKIIQDFKKKKRDTPPDDVRLLQTRHYVLLRQWLQ